MNRTPFKIFPDAREAIDMLSDTEAGRLLKTLVHYINGDVEELPGQERLVFAMLKQQYDRDNADNAEFVEKQRENGKKGGRPKKPTGFSENPKNPSLSVGFSENPKNPDNDYDYEYDYDKEHDVDVDNDRARGVSAAVDKVMAFATGELQYMGPRALEELQSFRDELPDDVILCGLNAACDNGKRTWAYARSILNRYVSAGFKSVGDVKAAEAKREAQKASMVSDGNGGKIVNPALNFQQRDNSDYSTDVDNSWMGEFMPTGG